jgi:predicted enzyme related to lactoylglutathione lyase
MFAPPPKTNAVILKTAQIMKMDSFYLDIGFCFDECSLPTRMRYFSYNNYDFHFALEEVEHESQASKNISFGFNIDSIEGYLPVIEKFDLEILRKPWRDEHGYHLLFKDPDGHSVKLSLHPSMLTEHS